MKIFLYSIVLSFIIATGITAYSDSVQSDLQNNIIRLHIIANSDSSEDQTIKLKIRDRILQNVQCGEDPNITAQKAAYEANNVLMENGFSYTAKGVYCMTDFPEKTYKNVTLPAGRYNAVEIILGSGKGHNWWCVLYPPVCILDKNTAVIDEESQKLLKENLDEETYDLITNHNGNSVEIKFRSVEIVQKLRELIRETKK